MLLISSLTQWISVKIEQIGTSSYLMEHSHGKDIAYIKKTALEVVEYVKSQGKEIRFSSEDSFRSNLVDLLTIYEAVDKIGVNRVSTYDLNFSL